MGRVRFGATIHPGRKARGADWADHLDVDRVPDTKGRIRALVSAEDLVRLLHEGYEIRLYSAYTDGPLDPSLIETDAAVRHWLGEQLRPVKKKPMPKPFVKSKGS